MKISVRLTFLFFSEGRDLRDTCSASHFISEGFDCRSVKVDPADVDNFPKMIELWFMFSMIWSICCSVDEDGRKKIDAYLREIDGSFPNKDSIYDYYVEPKTRSWIHWEEKLKQGWKLNPRFDSFLVLSLGLKPCIALHGNPSQSHGTSLVIWDHTVLPATRHK